MEILRVTYKVEKTETLSISMCKECVGAIKKKKKKQRRESFFCSICPSQLDAGIFLLNGTAWIYFYSSYCIGLATTTSCIANVFLQIVSTCTYISGPTDVLCDYDVHFIFLKNMFLFLRIFNHFRLEDAIMMFSVDVSSLSKREW